MAQKAQRRWKCIEGVAKSIHLAARSTFAVIAALPALEWFAGELDQKTLAALDAPN